MNATRIKAVVLRHLYYWTRSFSKMTDTFWWPFVDLLVWGLMTVFISRQAQGALPNLVLFLLSALILWTVIYRCQWEISLTLNEEIWSLNLLNLFASPLTIWEFLTAAVILGVIKLLGVLVFMFFFAWLLYAYNVFVVGFYFLPFIFVLVIFGWALGILVNAAIIRLGRNSEALAWTAVFLVQPFSAVFYPVSVLPGWAQNIAYLLPSTYVFEGLRSVLFTGTFPLINFWLGLSLDIFFLIMSLIIFKITFERAKELGLLSRLLE